MKEDTHLKVDTAIHGLMYVADIIDNALLGEKRHLDAQRSEYHGPFALALNRVAEIADGAPIPDAEKARDDLLFLFGLLHHLPGGFYSLMWDVLARAHELLADMITEQEAKAMMGKHAHWLNLDARLGHIHLLEERDGAFHSYDATFLGEPLGEVRYARYELEARRRIYDSMMKATH